MNIISLQKKYRNNYLSFLRKLLNHRYSHKKIKKSTKTKRKLNS